MKYTPRECRELVQRLTPRQVSVLKKVAEGKTSKQLAAELHLSQNYVTNIRFVIYRVMGVASNVEASRVALMAGLL